MNWLLRFKWYRRWRGLPEPSITAVEITNAALVLVDVLGNMDAVNEGWDQAGSQKTTITVRKPNRYTGGDGEVT